MLYVEFGRMLADMDDEDCLVDFSRKRKYGESPPRSTVGERVGRCWSAMLEGT